ncbi:carbohydrate ABC transporter permease [Anaerobium acetethylicum]|uniref:Multiple sugar transport system permease protein n=1 Tax=Anaerobium acetethylicum TaxID=1619234 RepID=A0A1D3TPX0_9FIRM|nr:carbohydrate ABC transporter permease [Anaerobium acetethylicum]SCP95591.1 multiple sugar transport system permease protein [Anaerobium acetethylicum]
MKDTNALSSRKKKTTVADIISLILLFLLTFIFVFPFYWIVTGAFKDQKIAVQLPPQWFPTDPTLTSFVTLFKNPALQWLWNSVFIALATMVLVCLTAALAGYVLAKKRFYGQALIFSMFIIAMALPKQVVLVPLVRMINALGFHNTMAAVILPAVGWPFGIFLMKQFSETIPGELLEAAKIDGCGELKTFFNIVIPIIKPGIAALAIFTFITAWNDYFMQLIMLNTRAKLTLPLGIATLQAEFATNYGVLMAGAALAAVPIVTVFIAFQKYFTQGITMGAVKG